MRRLLEGGVCFKNQNRRKRNLVPIQSKKIFLKPCGVKLQTKDVNYDLSSLSFNKHCFLRVNFLINAAFEGAAFIRSRVHKKIAFKRRNTVFKCHKIKLIKTVNTFSTIVISSLDNTAKKCHLKFISNQTLQISLLLI